MNIKYIKEKVQRKWNVWVNKTNEIRAWFAGRDMVDGSFLVGYIRIYDYCHEILRTNHGPTITLNVQPMQEGINDIMPHFRRLYICYIACKGSFKMCKHVIDLDGCFLKGLYGGQFLAAIGRNPNDQMLSITFVVVERETKDNWT